MPFVQRNWRGEVIGVYAVAQPGYAEEELADNAPDIVAFLAAHRPPPVRILTPKQKRAADASRQKAEADMAAIQQTVLDFFGAFHELELALSNLLVEVLGLTGRVAHAIYYSPTSFDTRAQMVINAALQIAAENKALEPLVSDLDTLATEIKAVRNSRNAIAHGTALTITSGYRVHARWTPPAFDIIRMKVKPGQIPGLRASDLEQIVRATMRASTAVDAANRVFHAFRDGDPSLPRTFGALTRSLRQAGSQSTGNRTSQAQRTLPRSSRA